MIAFALCILSPAGVSNNKAGFRFAQKLVTSSTKMPSPCAGIAPLLAMSFVNSALSSIEMPSTPVEMAPPVLWCPDFKELASRAPPHNQWCNNPPLDRLKKDKRPSPHFCL
jgi:hypothetical protein